MKKWQKITTTILLFSILISTITIILRALGLTTIEQIQQAIANLGAWGVIVFILLNWVFMLGQILPTSVINIAGVHIFGLWLGTLWNIVAVLIGAILLFILGRKFGVKIAKWVVGNEDIEKWRGKLTKGKYTLFILLLFPASPDSLLYVLAGMTKLKLKSYTIIILLSKPIGIITTGLFGGGAIIPIEWAYAWLWGLLGIVMSFIIYISIKHQDKIDKLFINKSLQ